MEDTVINMFDDFHPLRKKKEAQELWVNDGNVVGEPKIRFSLSIKKTLSTGEWVDPHLGLFRIVFPEGIEGVMGVNDLPKGSMIIHQWVENREGVQR